MGGGAFLRKIRGTLGQTGAQANCGAPQQGLPVTGEWFAPQELFEMLPDLIA